VRRQKLSSAGIVAASLCCTNVFVSCDAIARWVERPTQECSPRQVCAPVQRTEQTCRQETVCQPQQQTKQQCSVQNQCQYVTNYNQRCQPIQQCNNHQCWTQNQCVSVPYQKQVCSQRQICRSVVVTVQQCGPVQRCYPSVVTQNSCRVEQSCRAAVKKEWVNDPPQSSTQSGNPYNGPSPWLQSQPMSRIRPVTGGVITQRYGQPWSANSEKLHTGADIAANRGAPVYATSPGTVYHIGSLGKNSSTGEDWGNYVVVRRPDGTAAGYLHVDKASDLKKGDAVVPGQVIGTVFRNHVHYNNCRNPDICQIGAVTPDVFRGGEYLPPDLNFAPSN
jgi:hypothetical protein